MALSPDAKWTVSTSIGLVAVILTTTSAAVAIFIGAQNRMEHRLTDRITATENRLIERITRTESQLAGRVGRMETRLSSSEEKLNARIEKSDERIRNLEIESAKMQQIVRSGERGLPTHEYQRQPASPE